MQDLQRNVITLLVLINRNQIQSKSFYRLNAGSFLLPVRVRLTDSALIQATANPAHTN